MSLLKNQAAIQVLGTHSSLLARLGPIEPGQIEAALNLFSALYNQHAQLLAATIKIAGPSLNAVGSAPAFPDAIRTMSWCFDGKSPVAFWNTAYYPLARTGVKPSESNYRWVPENAKDQPTFWSEHWIQTLTGVDLDYFGTERIYENSPGVAYQSGVNPGGLRAAGFFTRALDTKFEMIVGNGVNEKRIETSWGVYITTIALPLLHTYQSVLRNLSDRLRATDIPSAALRKQVWVTLLSCSVDVTEFTLEKLEVLRDPAGSPIYLPPASVSAVRDQLMSAVVDSYRVIDASSRFEV